MPEKPAFWGVPQPWGPLFVYVLMTLASLIMLIRFYRQARLWWKIGLPEKCFDKPLKRLSRLISYTVIQVKVLGQTYAGIMHVAIAWSFFIFFLGTALGTIDGHFYHFLQGNPYLFYKLLLDLFTLFFIIGAAMAAYRRFIQRPVRLTQSPGFTWTLVLIIVIVFNGLVVESLRLARDLPPWAAWSPVGWGLAQLWIALGLTKESIQNWFLLAYFIHPTLAAYFLIILPASPLLHILTAPLNVFFSDPDRPVGQLDSISVNERGFPIYARSLASLTWSQLLNADTCTECGRCQEVCPAYAAGQSLNPKRVILDIRNALHQGVSATSEGATPAIQLLAETGIDEDVLWACTACGACVDECPVLIEQVGVIIDMRRALIDNGRIDRMLQDSLLSLSRYGNSFGQSGHARARWSQTLQPKLKDAREEAVEYLWFVGDYASYSPALTEITQITAKVFQHCGLDFGIIFDGESNAGNDVRRIGEEGLFELLVEKNAAALKACNFKAIVTTDPHSYNTLKNEYPKDVLAGRPVLHYSELLDQLIISGKLKMNKKLDYSVTYHDPCYLGRYNQVYDAPRRVIAATGCRLVEMPRHAARSFCCGAGGGRLWMEEKGIKERPSEIRVREASALPHVTVFIVTCPKDISMYKDALKTTSLDDRLVVKDLIELLNETL